MGDEQRPEAAEPAATSASTTAPGAETGAGGRRDQVTVRPASSEAKVGGEHEGEGQADAGSPDHRGGLGPRATTYATEAADETDLTKTATEAKGPLRLDDIEGHVLRAIRYHEARARFLDLCRRWLDFLVVLLGAGAITTATGGDKTMAGVMVGILLAGIGALQLVAGFSEKANDHTSLKRRFCGVLAEIMEARGEPPSERRLAKITKKWAAIWSDEPPTLHVLEAIAWNAARRAREYGLDESSLIDIPRWESWTRNLSSWESFEPLTRAERAERVGKASDGLRWWQRPRT
ncbi:MAG: hypothetical protein PGN25_15085 [Methylorubrum populi]